jgi:prepilin-type N-terminal cleavage/methylation domain-containing protein
MKQQKGLTLIEVMIAMMVIAVGVIAAAGLQATALKNTAKAQAVNEITKIAENELSVQRQLDLGDTTCQTQVSSGYTCSVAMVPCNIQSGAMICSSTVSSGIRAYQVSVSVADSRQNSISLSTIVALKEFAGQVAN